MATRKGKSEEISDTVRDKGKGETRGRMDDPTQRSGAVTDAELDRHGNEGDTAPVDKGERLRETHVDRQITNT